MFGHAQDSEQEERNEPCERPVDCCLRNRSGIWCLLYRIQATVELHYKSVRYRNNHSIRTPFDSFWCFTGERTIRYKKGQSIRIPNISAWGVLL